ncbi:MAG: hypothetical protein ABJG86_11150 [Nitratireductor sp.]
MKTLEKTPFEPLIENQRVEPRGDDQAAQAGRDPSGGGHLAQAAGTPGGHPRNRVSLIYGVKPVRFSGLKRADPDRREGMKIGATAPGAGVGETRYVYRWNRMGRKGQRCRVTARGALNSARVEFDDGFVAIISRYALRRAT